MMEVADVARDRARKRVKELKEFYSHLLIYLVVNAGLLLLDLVQGGGLQWAPWVLIGWGIGLAAHAVTVFVVESRLDSRWEERKIETFTEEERYRQSIR